LNAPDDGGISAAGDGDEKLPGAESEIVFVAEHVMVTLAVADLAGSATLVTVTLTVEGDGGTVGAT
jgi:hypothetical protein